MIKATVAFTGVDSIENPYPGLSVIRSIQDSKEFEGKVVVLTYGALCTGVYQKSYINQVYLIPFPSEPEGYLFSRLQEIHAKHRLDIIIPCLDSEIATYARLKPGLNELGIKVLVPSEESVKARAKIFLAEFCRQNGFDCPKTYVINQIKEMEHYAADIHYPFMLKGNIIDCAKVYNFEEAGVFFHRLSYAWGLPLVMQEYVDGEEYDIAIVANEESEIVSKVVIKKIGLTKAGKAFAGVTIEGQEFDQLAGSVVKALKWQGPLELEIRRNEDLNKTYIIEINARMPAWISATRGAELNLPLINLKLALGEKLQPIKQYKTGVMFVRITNDAFCGMEELTQLNLKGELSWS